jgi:hypothetical protein
MFRREQQFHSLSQFDREKKTKKCCRKKLLKDFISKAKRYDETSSKFMIPFGRISRKTENFSTPSKKTSLENWYFNRNYAHKFPRVEIATHAKNEKKHRENNA